MEDWRIEARVCGPRSAGERAGDPSGGRGGVRGIPARGLVPATEQDPHRVWPAAGPRAAGRVVPEGAGGRTGRVDPRVNPGMPRHGERSPCMRVRNR